MGGLNLSDGIDNALRYMTFDTYIYTLTWRAIPYFVLYLVIRRVIKQDYYLIKPLAWGGLMGIVIFISIFTWLVLEPIYTEEKYSSTSVISIILIPIFSIFFGGFSSIIAILLAKLCSKNKQSR